MNRFDYCRASSTADAVTMGEYPGSIFLAGGTNLVDLMKENVIRPELIIDINALRLDSIEDLPDGGLRLGALVTNAATLIDDRIQSRYPLLASAILSGASPQLRNAATNGGNLNQRTRCYYFYDNATVCNKRVPGSGCGAIGGITRIHAILGASTSCIATHPSDMCVALAALNATVRVTSRDAEREIAFSNYHRLPGDEPWRDNTLEPGEIVTAIDLPPEGFSEHYSYLKIRDRLSYSFALVSVAAALKISDGRIEDARITLGGVAHRPWRKSEAEDILKGKVFSRSAFTEAARALLAGSTGQGDNDFKITLAQKAIVRALEQAANGTPQSQIDKRVA